jgi:hypothetical protein
MTMNDEQLDQLLEAARPRFRVPPEPKLDTIWERVSAARHPAPLRRPTAWLRWAGVAAGLVLAFSLGRLSTTSETTAVASTQSEPAVSNGEQPVAAAATELLGETVVLLSALHEGQATELPDRAFARQAGLLLGTTRLLIDSRVAERDPALKSLLQDLELVLAQLARLRTGEAHGELQLINDALQEQDIVPRIRSVAAGLSAGAD